MRDPGSASGLVAVVLAILAICFVGWGLTHGIRSDSGPSSSRPAAEGPTVKYPPPAWMKEGARAFIPAVVGFRIDRAKLDRYPLPVSSLSCGNTQFCVYGVQWCEPFRIGQVNRESVDLFSPAGPWFQAVGPFEAVFPTRDACRARLKTWGDGLTIAIERNAATISLARE